MFSWSKVVLQGRSGVGCAGCVECDGVEEVGVTNPGAQREEHAESMEEAFQVRCIWGEHFEEGLWLWGTLLLVVIAPGRSRFYASSDDRVISNGFSTRW